MLEFDFGADVFYLPPFIICPISKVLAKSSSASSTRMTGVAFFLSTDFPFIFKLTAEYNFIKLIHSNIIYGNMEINHASSMISVT